MVTANILSHELMHKAADCRSTKVVNITKNSECKKLPRRKTKHNSNYIKNAKNKVISKNLWVWSEKSRIFSVWKTYLLALGITLEIVEREKERAKKKKTAIKNQEYLSVVYRYSFDSHCGWYGAVLWVALSLFSPLIYPTHASASSSRKNQKYAHAHTHSTAKVKLKL